MEIETTSDTVRTIAEVLDATVDEGAFEFTDDELFIEVKDPGDVSYSSVSIPDEYFDKYDCDREKIGFSVKNLDNIISLSTGGEETVNIKQTTKGKIQVKIGSVVEYNFGGIDPNSMRPAKDPNVSLPIKFTVKKRVLGKSITAAEMVSGVLSLRMDDGVVTLLSEGDTDDIKYTPDDEEIDIQNEGDAETMYSLELLEDMVGAMPIDGDADVTVEFGDEMPLQMTYTYDGSVSVKHVLAPRITNNK